MNSRRPLTRESIVDAAIELLDERGLDGLSTRALADRLEVKQPALYWHFPTKDAVIQAIGERITLASGMGELPGTSTWEDWVEARAHRYRSALLEHRDGARIAAGMREASPSMQALFADELAEMARLGFTPTLAIQTIATISHLVTGFVLREQITQSDPKTAADSDPTSENTFSHAVRVLIVGTRDALSEGRMDRSG